MKVNLYFRYVVSLFLCFFITTAAVAAGKKAPKQPKGPVTNPPLKEAPVAKPGPDPVFMKQWHLMKMGVPEVWQETEGDPSVTIAVIDSGINYNNPDLAANLWHNPEEIPNNGIDDDRNGFVDDVIGWDFVLNQPLPFDRSGHGTFITSLMAAVRNNSEGGVGVCPKCTVMPLRFLNGEGMGDTEDAIYAFYYAIEKKPKVINLSFAGEGKDSDLERAIIKAGYADIFVVVSAGNDAENIDYTSVYPAKYDLPNMITVAAVAQDNNLNYRSNWGRHSVHIGAPGDDLWGIWFDKWDTGDGTSDAAALVSGAAGLIRSLNPKLTAAQVKDIFMATAAQSSRELQTSLISGGQIDVAAAARCAKTLECLRK